MDVFGFQGEAAADFAGGVVECGGDGWSGEGIGGFGTSAVGTDFGIMDEDDFDFGVRPPFWRRGRSSSHAK